MVNVLYQYKTEDQIHTQHMSYFDYDDDLFEQCDFERRLKRERQFDHPNPIQDSDDISQNKSQKKWTFREQNEFQQSIKNILNYSETCHQVSKNRHGEEENKDSQLVHVSFYFEDGSLKLKLNSFVSCT